MEKKQIITKDHEDFMRLMYAIDRELQNYTGDAKYAAFYRGCKRLEDYRGYKIDKDKTLAWMQAHGGYNDVEILLNAQFA